MATKAAPLKEQIKPELLPVDLGGGSIEFVKRSDYAKRTAETFALKFKADIKRDHVTQMLDAMDSGMKELQGENPDEIVKLFNTVQEDYNAGIEKVETDREEERKKKEETERLANEKKDKEEKLFLATKDTAASFEDLSKTFDTGNMDRFVPKADVTTEALIGALNSSFTMGEFTSWMQGDLVVALEDRGELNVVSRIAEARSYPYSSLYNKSKTCRQFPPDKRVKGVSFTICSEVANAKFTPDQRTKEIPALVERVLAGELNSQTVREEVRKIQGKKDAVPVLPEENEKKEFIVVDPNAELPGLVTIAVGFPRALFDAGAIVIDPQTKLEFDSFKKKPENRWVAIKKYEAPAAAEKEEPAAAAATNGRKGAKKK